MIYTSVDIKVLYPLVRGQVAVSLRPCWCQVYLVLSLAFLRNYSLPLHRWLPHFKCKFIKVFLYARLQLKSLAVKI